MATKTWVIKIELEIKEDSNPRKFIPDTICEVLDLNRGEDIINIEYICLDWLLTMETSFDFPELETEWQDDMLIPADDDYESELHFQQFINSNTDY